MTQWFKFTEKLPDEGRWIWSTNFPPNSAEPLNCHKIYSPSGWCTCTLEWTYAEVPELPKEEIKTEWHKFVDEFPDLLKDQWHYTGERSYFCRSGEIMLDAFTYKYYWTYGTADKQPEPPILDGNYGSVSPNDEADKINLLFTCEKCGSKESLFQISIKEAMKYKCSACETYQEREDKQPQPTVLQVKTEWHNIFETIPDVLKDRWYYTGDVFQFVRSRETLLLAFNNEYYWTYGTKDKKPEPPVIEPRWIEYAKERPQYDGWYYVSHSMEGPKDTDYFNGVEWCHSLFDRKYWRAIPQKDKKYGKV